MEGGGWREQLGMQGSEQLSHTRDSVDSVTGEWAVMVAVCHVPRVDRVAVTVGLTAGRGEGLAVLSVVHTHPCDFNGCRPLLGASHLWVPGRQRASRRSPSFHRRQASRQRARGQRCRVTTLTRSEPGTETQSDRSYTE